MHAQRLHPGQPHRLLWPAGQWLTQAALASHELGHGEVMRFKMLKSHEPHETDIMDV